MLNGLPENTRYLDAIFPDLNGIFRGKRLPIEQAEKALSGGLRMPRGVYLLSVVGSNDDACGYGVSDGDPDRALIADGSSLVPVPWLDAAEDGGVAQVLVRHVEDDGSPLAFDPRTLLERVVAQFLERELTPVVAVELEFYLIDPARQPGEAPRPPLGQASGKRERSTQVYSMDQLDENRALFDAIYAAAAAQNVPVTALTAEYSPGQYEVNLKHCDDPVQACTDALLLRRIIEGVAKRQGLAATFAAKPYLEESGSGMHLHVSLLDKDGANIFASDRATLEAAIGGLFDLWSEAQALYAPNINSFRRFAPDSYAPINKTWGLENRLTAARVPGGGDGARRIEWRTPGADANPYLAMAATLASMLHGIENACDPGPEITEPVHKPDASLPLDQHRALSALKLDGALSDYLSPEFLEIYRETKRLERKEFDAVISAREYDWYLMDGV